MDTLSGIPAFQRVVLIADVVAAEETQDGDLAARRDLEQTESSTLAALIAAVREHGIELVHYQSPEELGRNASSHRDDLVLSVYGGSASRNRMALIPAVCETYGLRFVGPDTYGRIIAQDKEVSKRLALDCGLRTPNWRVIRDEHPPASVHGMSYPCVVKPLLEGSSIGITQDNLVRTPADAETIGARLLKDFAQPVLIEEFVRGRETSFCAIQGGDTVDWAYSEMVVAGDPDFFTERLFDVVEKRMAEIELRSLADKLSAEIGKRVTTMSLNQVRGVYARRIDLAQGRVALIIGERQASLVPWRPALERFAGRQVEGVLRGQGLSWGLARAPGLGLGLG